MRCRSMFRSSERARQRTCIAGPTPSHGSGNVDARLEVTHGGRSHQTAYRITEFFVPAGASATARVSRTIRSSQSATRLRRVRSVPGPSPGAAARLALINTLSKAVTQGFFRDSRQSHAVPWTPSRQTLPLLRHQTRTHLENSCCVESFRYSISRPPVGLDHGHPRP